MRYLSGFFALALSVGAVGGERSGRVFITQERDNTVSVIDSRTGKVEASVGVGKQLRGIGIAPEGGFVYVALGDKDQIAVLDVTFLKIVCKLPSGADPESFAVPPNGNLYISNEEDAKASVLDPKTGQVVEIPVG